MTGIAFAKGHGTQNDFVVLPDPDGLLELTEDQVRRLCDRQSGIGADGVLRVVRSAALDDGVRYAQSAEWFMDYRNADGSIAEMCGNGVRVFARYLRDHNLVDRTASIAIATRGGIKDATFEIDDTVSVDMGPARDLGSSSAQVNGVTLVGRAVSMGNPHLVCSLAEVGIEVAQLDLQDQPAYVEEFFPDGVNLEFVEPMTVPAGYDAAVRMRVHERGVGETRSCGTGICAVAYDAIATLDRTAGRVYIEVPGGQLSAQVSPERMVLRGPALIVAEGTLAAGFFE